MTLTKEQRAARAEKITASFLTHLMEGDGDAIHDKWLECIGDPSWKPRDRDSAENWAMALGAHIEPLALDWHERRTRHELSRRGEVVVHPARPFFCCTLDAWRADDRTCLDCKWIDGHNRLDDWVVHYIPQLIGQRGCTGADRAALLVVHGGAAPQEIEARIDPEYEALVWQRVDQFWQCVETLTPPVAVVPMPRIVPPEQWRTVNLDDADERARHNWAAAMCDHLGAWRETRAAAERNDAARAGVKSLLPEDVGKLHFAGVQVRRNRAGAVSLKETAA